jgi:hypothetical protein
VIVLIRRLHILAGLLVFSQFLVYGIAGLVASVQPSLERPKVPYLTRTVAFVRQPGESDKQVGMRVYELLKPQMSRPVPDWALQKSSEGYLRLDFYNVNGILRAFVEPTQLRVEHIRNSTGIFIEDIHAATLNNEGAAPLIRAWAAWNELGIWALLFFSVTGLYLWLATRPAWVWGWVTLGVSCAVFGAFWVVLQ